VIFSLHFIPHKLLVRVSQMPNDLFGSINNFNHFDKENIFQFLNLLELWILIFFFEIGNVKTEMKRDFNFELGIVSFV